MIFNGDIALPYRGAIKYAIPDFLARKIWVGNLEGSLVDKAEHQGVYNSFEAVSELCNHLSYKVFSIANNHLLDDGDVSTTKENIRRLGIIPIGAGKNINDASESHVVRDDDGLAYRLLSFGWENIQCKVASARKEGVNPYSRGNVIKCVKNALNYNEPVICFMHWDYELERYPQPYDRQLAHDLIDMGVCAVIGCHAHRVQPIEFYKGHPIVYGLGNFLFCQGYYFGGNLRFPRYCEEEYAFEICNNQFVLHYLMYNQQQNQLEYIEGYAIDDKKDFKGRAEFTGLTAEEYEKWFREHRTKKKLLPVFTANGSGGGVLNYWLKSEWIKVRGAIIDILTDMELKSADRSKGT